MNEFPERRKEMKRLMGILLVGLVICLVTGWMILALLLVGLVFTALFVVWWKFFRPGAGVEELWQIDGNLLRLKGGRTNVCRMPSADQIQGIHDFGNVGVLIWTDDEGNREVVRAKGQLWQDLKFLVFGERSSRS